MAPKRKRNKIGLQVETDGDTKIHPASVEQVFAFVHFNGRVSMFIADGPKGSIQKLRCTSGPLNEQAEGQMQIFIRDLDGRLFTIDASPQDTIADIKEKIQNKRDIAPDRQRLIWSGKQLEEQHTLQEYGIGKDSTLHLVARLSGS